MINMQDIKKCLVTGGAGFIGSNLVDELVSKGWDVTVIDNLSTGKREYVNPKAKFFELDIRNFDSIRPLFEGIDYVFHLAALPRVQLSIEEPVNTHDNNVNGALNVLLAASQAKVKKFIYSASSSAYGYQDQLPWVENMVPAPFHPYGAQKFMVEHYCNVFSHCFGLPTVSLRYFNAYGFRQSAEGAYAPVISTFIKQRLAGQPMTIIGDGEQTRDYTNVKDIVRANILAAESDKVGKGEVINVGAGKNYSINDLAKIIGGPIVHEPERIEVKHSLADNTLAKSLLDWTPEINMTEWLENHLKEVGLR